MKKYNNSLLFFLGIVIGLFFAGFVEASPVQFHLRHQETIFLETSIDLPPAGFVTLTDTDGVGHDVNSRSVLALLSNIDSARTEFDISVLQFFSSFDSFYVKCIRVAVKSLEACDNWQYVVNDIYPPVGMDKYILSGGEDVWIFFGDIRKVVAEQGEFYTTKPFTFRAEQYQYAINGWSPVTGYTIGIKKGNTVVATQPVDSLGKASFTVSEPGSYIAGIVEDFYFPSTPFLVDLFVPPLGPTGGNVQQLSPSIPSAFDVERAYAFLSSNQKEEGSIGPSIFLSDWSTIALSTKDGEAKLKMKNYLLSDPNPGNVLTDYERRAMALMSLGINPYSGTPTNYIEKILKQFDGTQFGSPDLVNDDIFALLVLLRAGYSLKDDEIQKAVSFVLSSQNPQGSWGNVDLTAAAVQALSLIKETKEIQDALEKAKTFLLSNQKEDGSFGNVYSTAWALQALSALNASGQRTYVFSQAQDGGLLEGESLENRIWATAYAIPAALGKSWGSILLQFERPLSQISPQIKPKAESKVLSETELAQIETQVQQIAREVDVLKREVAIVYTQYLVKSLLEKIAFETAMLKEKVAQYLSQPPSSLPSGLAQAPSQPIGPKETPELTLKTEPLQKEPLQKEDLGIYGAIVSAGWRARTLGVVLVGVAIFFLLGGFNYFLPFLRRVFLRV